MKLTPIIYKRVVVSEPMTQDAEGVEKGEHVIRLYLILIRPSSSGFMF